jgi:TrmH family RNA methyltransferase
MPSKNEIKFIRALKQNKYRNTHGLFVAEGEKLVLHLLKIGLKGRYLFTTVNVNVNGFKIISQVEMSKISFLKTPSSVFAVFEKPVFSQKKPSQKFLPLLDGIRDPGNLGTILRLCDWFGLPQLICTEDCVDVFNEKVVQASMGSVSSIHVFTMTRTEIAQFISKENYTVYGADMDGASIYETNYASKSILVLGNEGKGISEELESLITKKITIPSAENAHAESLNVAIAASILVSDYARKSNSI